MSCAFKLGNCCIFLFGKIAFSIVLFSVLDGIFDLALCIFNNLIEFFLCANAADFILCPADDLIDLVLEVFLDVIGQIGSVDLVLSVLCDLVEVSYCISFLGFKDSIFDLALCVLDRLFDLVL